MAMSVSMAMPVSMIATTIPSIAIIATTAMSVVLWGTVWLYCGCGCGCGCAVCLWRDLLSESIQFGKLRTGSQRGWCVYAVPAQIDGGKAEREWQDKQEEDGNQGDKGRMDAAL